MHGEQIELPALVLLARPLGQSLRFLSMGRKTEELKHLNEQYASKDRQIRELQSHIEEIRSQHGQMVSDLEQQRARCQDLQDRNDQLIKKEIDGNLAERQRAEQEHQRAVHMEEELGIERQRHAQTQKLLNEVGSQSAIAVERVEQLQEALSQKEQEIEDLLTGSDHRMKEVSTLSLENIGSFFLRRCDTQFLKWGRVEDR